MDGSIFPGQCHTPGVIEVKLLGNMQNVDLLRLVLISSMW